MLERGRLPARLAVRGLVRLARPRRRGDRADHRRPPARRLRGLRADPGSNLASGMASTATSLDALAALLATGERHLALRRASPDDEPALGALAAAGPARRDAPGEYALLVEAIREGYLLHYESRGCIEGADADLRAARRRLPLRARPRAARRARRPGRGRELADLISLGGAGSRRGGARHPWIDCSGARLWLGRDGGGRRRRHRRAQRPRRRCGARPPDARLERLVRNAAETAAERAWTTLWLAAAEAIGFAAEDVPKRG